MFELTKRTIASILEEAIMEFGLGVNKEQVYNRSDTGVAHGRV